MAVTQQQVAEVYVATFNRAPDAAGLDYWVNTSFGGNPTIEQIAASFFDQSETQALYPEGTTDEAFVTSIYQNLFNRAPDADGLAYWTGTDGLGGAMTRDVMIEAMKNGATGDDAEIIANKAEVGLYYAEQGLDGTYSLASVTADDATVTTAKTEVDALVPAAGETYELTTGSADVVESSTGDDTITGTTSTLQSGDQIVDASTDDNDTFNLTLTAANATTPTVKNIENVNVELDYFTGTATDLDMTNYSNSTVTLGSSKLGFNGVSGATAVGANTVKAGSNVDTFTVAGLSTGTVDAGSATTVTVAGLAGVANTIVINGDITTGTGLVNTTSTKTTLDFTAAAEVLYNPSAATIATTITGDNDVTLTMASADIITGTSIKDSTEGTITLKTADGGAGAFDSTNFAVDKIIIDNAATNAATVASGQVIETSADIGTKLTIATTATSATEVTLNLGNDITELDVKDDKLVTTINNTDNNSIATLTADGEKVVVTGSGNLVIGSADVKTFDASAATGELTLTTEGTASTSLTISGTTGKNTVTVGAAGETVSFTGQGGVDTVDATVALTGIVAGDLGGGADVLKLNTLGVGATVAVAGGAGDDILKITDGADLSAMTAAGTWAVTGFEEIQMQGAVDVAVTATTLTAYGSQLNGTTYNVTTKEAIDTVAATVTLDAASTDLSKLTFAAGDTVAINGSATTSYTVVGTNVDDTITLGSNAASKASTVTGGAGDDTFVVAANNTTASNMLKISDYQAAAAASDNDTLDLDVTTVAADKTLDVSLVFPTVAGAGGGTIKDGEVVYDAAAAIFADATGSVNLVVDDGFMTITGLSADVALADTLAEMITLAQTAMVDDAAQASVAFVFGGNTYVVQAAAGTAYVSADTAGADVDPVLGAVENVIELTGLTTATDMAASAAANTILLG